MPLHIETPLLESLPLSTYAGRTVHLKLEALQPSGSFKTRGIGALCEAHARAGVRRFVSSSGGNAGMAVAYAGRRLGIPVTVVVPSTTTERALKRIRDEGADAIVHGDSWLEAHTHAEGLTGPHDALIHPFDEPRIWDGHATMIDEIARTSTRPDAVVVSVGGGGLLCGVIEGLRRNGWGDVRVIAVETEGAESLHRSLEANARVTLAAITSIATSLGAKQVCERAFDLARDCERNGALTSVVVSDAAAVSACLRFVDDHRLVVEPACGAALALAYDGHPSLATAQRVVIVVCGGATVGIDQLRNWEQR
jgi:L-serine/L-threonine ammonia-lyase